MTMAIQLYLLHLTAGSIRRAFMTQTCFGLFAYAMARNVSELQQQICILP